MGLDAVRFLRSRARALVALVARLALRLRAQYHLDELRAPPSQAPAALLEVAPAPEPVAAIPSVPARQPRRLRSRAVDPLTEDLRWHFRAAILERLDEYFVCFDRLKRHDVESYRTFARLGFAIAPDLFRAPSDPLALAQRPTFGGILIPQEPRRRGEEKMVTPSFVYFRKMQSVGGVVQFWEGDVYAVTTLYDDRDYSHHWQSRLAVPATCHVGITADGETILMRELITARETIYPGAKRHGGRRPEPIKITNRFWAVPDWVREIAEKKGREPNAWVGDLLKLALATYTEALDRIVIRVKQRGLTAAFGIELPRAKYFFKDRDSTALARDGRRKRIFHSVRKHERLLADARTTAVREHYRGLRVFDWNGYQVRIVLPDNAHAVNFDAPAYYPADQSSRRGLLEEPVVARKLEAMLDA